MRRKLTSLMLLLTLLLCSCTPARSNNSPSAPVSAAKPGTLQVHFIDVGQADCILIQSQNQAMLIDAGNNDDGALITEYLQNAGVTQLEYAVGTHPHEDHIGALDTVLQNFPVKQLLMPRIQANTDTFEDVLDAAIEKNLSITAPKAGDTFPLGDATVTAVSNYTGDDLNNSSIMLRLTYGKTAFLFTADAETNAEKAALATGLSLQSDVLKVGHHGSSTSTAAPFLAAVDPTYAVITCGKDNEYGHPHQETMTALAGRTIFRTDEQGSITATTDGSTITWSTAGTVLPGASEDTASDGTYVLNTSSKKFHLPTCGGVTNMSEKNKKTTQESRQQLLAQGFAPCGTCNP